MYQKRQIVDHVLILTVNILVLLFSSAIAFWLRYRHIWGIAKNYEEVQQIGLIIVICFISYFINNSGHHFFTRGKFDELIILLREKLLFTMLWIVLLYLEHQAGTLSRLVLCYLIITDIVMTYVAYQFLKAGLLKFYQKSKYSDKLLLLTTKSRVKETVENIVSYNEWSRKLSGIAYLDGDGSEEAVGNIPIVSGSDDFMDYVIHHDVDEVFIVDDQRKHSEQIENLIPELEMMGVIVDVNIDVFDLNIHGLKKLNRVGKYATVTFTRNIFSTRQLVAKRCLDVCGSLVGILILAVATLFVAPAIKLESPGPVFFGQTRVGKNGRKFTFYKFRSMYQDAEQRKKELMAKNEVQGLMFKMQDDPRITKVGKFIRKTSIDELPQFWNVLRGDMSLVGTRPPIVDEFEQYEAKHKCRLSMTPGLTGLWQISGRSDIKDFDEVVKLDMQYIDNWSILKDIKILLKTVVVVILGKGSR